jgi:hypothetical protein
MKPEVLFSIEWAQKFLDSEQPDSMFPCDVYSPIYIYVKKITTNTTLTDCRGPWFSATDLQWKISFQDRYTQPLLKKALINIGKDQYGRCKLKCANCNAKMLFNEMTCVKADLETTKAMLKSTMNALEEERQHNANKREHFAIAMSKMRSELDEVKECCRDKMKEKEELKQATSEAAKVALSASNYITLRLLMF